MAKRDVFLANDCYKVERIKDWSAYFREKEDTVLSFFNLNRFATSFVVETFSETVA